MGRRSPVQDVDSKLNRARTDHGAGRLAAASRVYDRILLDSPDRADVLHLRAILARQTGDSDLAIKLLRRAVTNRGDVPQFLNSLGLALTEAGRFDEAGIAFTRVLKLDGSYPGALTSLATARYGQGNFDEAHERLKRAIELDPQDARALASLGCMAFERNDDEAAQGYLTRAARLDENYAFGAFCHMGEAFFTHAAISRLPDLIAALPEIAGEYPVPVAGRPIVTTCCDPVTYSRFARNLIESFDRNAPGGQFHLHLINPEQETADDVDRLSRALQHTSLSVTSEHGGAAERGYIDRVRFARLVQFQDSCDAELFSLDADSLILAGLDTLSAAADQGDIAAPLRPELAQINLKIFAAALLIRQTDAARRLLRHTASYILSVSANAPAPRHLDQCALYFANSTMGRTDAPAIITKLPRQFADRAFDDSSSVWIAGAGRQFSHTLAGELPE